LENEKYQECRNEEDGFFIFMRIAKQYEKSDEKLYLRYLSKALDIYPNMKEGIKLLLEEVKKISNIQNNEMEEYKLQLKNNIKLLIDSGKIEDAKNVISEYEKIIKDDMDIYSFKAVIFILQNKLTEAEEILKFGINIDKNNFDLNYNLAYIYEQKSLYLKALEIYGKIVFNMEDSEQRQQIIAYLNELEDKHREVIQKQLEESKENEEVVCEGTEEKLNLHLMYDSQYCDKFINFVNENCPKNEHKFIVIGNINEKFKYMNIDGIENVHAIDLRYDLDKILNYIKECSRIFVHYLFDYFCELVCKFNINKPIYWAVWGGDLYNYIDIELYKPMTKECLRNLGFVISNNINKNTIEYVYRRSTIRKIKYVLTEVTEDFVKLRENFITNSSLLEFTYPNPVNFIKLVNEFNCEAVDKYNFNGKFKYVILAGNSANPTNNHLEILGKLKSIKSKDFCVIMPLSYGGHDTYVTFIINEGKKLFGDRFMPLTEYLNPKNYFHILKQVDIAIFNQNRQQAVSNITILAYLGKKIFLNNDVTTYHWLENIGIKNVQNMNEINSDMLLSNMKVDNKNLIENYYSIDHCLDNFDKILKIY
jgi:tetratricopeptide (TPR) repeat protein